MTNDEDALALLKRRLAAGEIDEETYTNVCVGGSLKIDRSVIRSRRWP